MSQSLKLSGIVNNIHGDPLPSAYISLVPDQKNTVSDENGAFHFITSSGERQIFVSHLGYQAVIVTLRLRTDTTISLTMTEVSRELKTVTIEGTVDRNQHILKSNQTSTNMLNQNDITSIPVLGGEADLIKTLQLLPGAVRGVEGSSDLFVRGGAADQNLVLLDGAPIYNTSHLFGFLSVFNPETLESVESINGGFPAHFGGRLSSILNVKTTSTLADTTYISGDIGLLASRLMIEQPVIKNKLSFWVAGRRTYIDQVVKTVGEELPYFFYDLNGKLIYRPSARNALEFSYYRGDDQLDLFRDRNNDGDGFLTTYTSGNDSQSLTWKHNLTRTRVADLSLARSRYNYNISNIFEDNKLLALSDIQDLSGKLTLTDSLLAGSVTTGLEWTRHAISPNVINTEGLISELLESSRTNARLAHEIAVHASYSWRPVRALNFTAGLRLSSAVVKNKTYVNPEPRFSATYELGDNEAVKLSYARMVQYIHRISNSAISTPTDIWYPVTDSIRPQASHQIAAGWQRTWPRKIFFSAEGYYKIMTDLIGYQEGTNLFFNTDFQSRLIQGSGMAWGSEFLLRKDAGRLTGWISYTLSWSWRKFDQINNGDWFPSRYDRRHNGAVVAQYKIRKRWAISMVWEFISGSRFTPVIGQYMMLAPTLSGVDLIPVYAKINQVKLADTHRLDLALKFLSNPGRKFQWHWFVGVYNVYNRASPVGINIRLDESTGTLKYEQPGLFGLLPFISYGFKL